MKTKSLLTLFLVAVICGFCGHANARTGVPQDPQTEPQGGPPQDPILQLNLTPEQREKIRAVREQTKGERAAINNRLREANVALEQALDVENPDEAVIEQRLRDVAAAQAAAMRMRVLTEVRIRKVLTAEQLQKLRILRQQAQQMRRNQQMDFPNRRPADRNGVTPLLRRPNPQRNPRP